MSNEENKETCNRGETRMNQEKMDDGEEDVNASEEQAMIIDDDTLNWTGAEKEMDDKEATNHDGEIEIKVNNLLKQMSVISGQLQQLYDTVATFIKCKSCQKKFYKSLDDSDVSLEDVETRQKKMEENPALSTPATLHRCQAATPTPVASSSPLGAQKKAKVVPVQPKITIKELEDSDAMMLVGSASRGIYLSKKKVDLLSKSTPKLFALKLFELVFSREEAKEGSVEGKGEKLHQLDPNRLAALREHAERVFTNEVISWPEIKKAIDEKCRMVRNNRCTLWAGIKTKKD